MREALRDLWRRFKSWPQDPITYLMPPPSPPRRLLMDLWRDFEKNWPSETAQQQHANFYRGQAPMYQPPDQQQTGREG